MLASQMLGFPPEAGVLLVNADDLGMHPAVNRGVFDAIENGIVRAVHPAAADRPPAPALSGWLVRSTDHRFLTSARARELVEAEGVTLIDYVPLQQMWTAIIRSDRPGGSAGRS